MHEVLNQFIKDVATGVSDDCLELLQAAEKNESSASARDILRTMLENVALAGERTKAVCQSPGFPACFVTFGQKCTALEVMDMLPSAITEATNNGYLRPSIVNPLTRKNTGDNSGPGVPGIYAGYVEGQPYTDVIVSFKGCGAELGNAVKIFTPAQLGKNLRGLQEFILKTVIDAGGKPCPPVALGIGIGGQMDTCARLSRQAVSVRDWRDTNPDPELAKMEHNLLHAINELGIGPAGIGGDTTALAVKIEMAFTHTAIAPVAVNFHCWVARKGGLRIHPDGTTERLF
jgi:fumarate hydratase subunit alpha